MYINIRYVLGRATKLVPSGGGANFWARKTDTQVRNENPS